MTRKIVIIPEFASSHFLKCWIPNMIECLEPNVIIINSGLFPQGPENKGHIDGEFKEKWCYSGPDTTDTVGFDWVDTIATFMDNCVKHDCTGHLVDLRYRSDWDANKCFLTAISTFHKYQPEVGDVVFPLEPDAFLLETDAKIIQEEINKLKPGEGLSCKWVDFLETQYYTEAVNMSRHKYRRFCYCFDNMENYREAMSGFMSQEYQKLKKTNEFFIRHYCWFQPEPWKQLRYDLIWRSDPKYWQDFEEGLQEIRRLSIEWRNINDPLESQCFDHDDINFHKEVRDKILIRPSRTDEGRWAQFIDVPHPEAIKSHPNFVK